ncbi:MAG: hypothetical protein V7704_04365 [Aurantimonas endophytica]|uniref:hypothetical protein n=1 Tax=Aurantimonas endophytica TaxID=1522175 RepID=UPI003002869D
MTQKNGRIADNPSTQELSAAIPFVRAVRRLARLSLKMGIKSKKAQKIIDSADMFIAESDILDLPDRFNAAFSDKGWVATSSLSTTMMRNALNCFEDGDYEGAETIILDWLTPDTINMFAIRRSKPFNKAKDRWHQLQEALALTEEGRYWSAVPLILIACDGFASDVLGTSPFEKNADLALFDSIVGHPTSLPSALSRILKGVRKSSDEPVDLPLRHGILHGRSLGYANRTVCGKSWLLMIALVDWAVDKRDEEARRVRDKARKTAGWADILASLRLGAIQKKAISEFRVREWDPPFDSGLEADEPPNAFREFLSAWQAKNFGLMASRAVNLTGQPQAKLAGRMRSDAEIVQLTSFDIVSVSQTTVARAEAHVRMFGQTLRGEVGGEFNLLAFRNTPDGGIAIPTDEGVWQIQQRCIFDLMNERTAEKRNL